MASGAVGGERRWSVLDCERFCCRKNELKCTFFSGLCFFFFKPNERGSRPVGHADTELNSSLSFLQRVLLNQAYDETAAGEARRARRVRRR